MFFMFMLLTFQYKLTSANGFCKGFQAMDAALQHPKWFCFQGQASLSSKNLTSARKKTVTETVCEGQLIWERQ
jgi:hypothetical protein